MSAAALKKPRAISPEAAKKLEPLPENEKIRLETARAFQPLLLPRLFRGARGGRASGKSHFISECLIEDVLDNHHRVVCAREFQNSIAESSKQLITDKINALGLAKGFEITEKEIRYAKTESLFVFKGLHGQSAESLKSMEGYDRFWNEEAQSTSQRSMDLIIPTFRKKGSQMWFSWNPYDPTDPVEVFFNEGIATHDPDFALVTVDYRSNPWFGDESQRNMERDRRRDPDKYAHIWKGKYRSMSQARVFSNWTIEAFETPKDARFYFGADWGFSIDPTVLIRCYIDEARKKLFVDQEAYKIGCKIGDTPALFDKVPESRKWPIRADSARPETIDYMKDHGFPKMESAEKGKNSVADGVEFLKDFDIVVHPRCVHTSDELSFYSYKVDPHTEEVLPVLADKKNHVIDALRYAVEAIRKSKSVRVTPEFLNALRGLANRSPNRLVGTRPHR